MAKKKAKKKKKTSKKKAVKRKVKKKAAKKQVKKKTVKKVVKKKVSKKVKKNPVKKIAKKKPVQEKKGLAYFSFVLSIVSLVVMAAYIVALIMLKWVNGALLLFTYLAAIVVFVVALLGVGLSTADLALHPNNELSRKALYINLIILCVTFTLFMIKVL